MTHGRYTRTLKQALCNVLEDVFEGGFEARVSQPVSKASRTMPLLAMLAARRAAYTKKRWRTAVQAAVRVKRHNPGWWKGSLRMVLPQ